VLKVVCVDHYCSEDLLWAGKAKGAMACRSGGTPMEGAMQDAVERFFRYYSDMPDALRLNFVL
jgi:hypothetical protein